MDTIVNASLSTRSRRNAFAGAELVRREFASRHRGVLSYTRFLPNPVAGTFELGWTHESMLTRAGHQKGCSANARAGGWARSAVGECAQGNADLLAARAELADSFSKHRASNPLQLVEAGSALVRRSKVWSPAASML